MTFNWNDEKNEILKKQRNISFEEIVILISENKIVDILNHPNFNKYPNQYLYLINYENYIYVVPCVINKDENEIFLKTIFPSRDYTRKYISRSNKNE